MVRRRARTTKVPSVSSGCLLEDQYIASPKRKECKVENGVTEADTTSTTAVITARSNYEGVEPHLRSKELFGRNRIEEDNTFGGKSVGIPIATRSQVRTIETFFKADTRSAIKNNKLREAEGNKSNNSMHPQSPHHYIGLQKLQFDSMAEEYENKKLQITHASMHQPHTHYMQHDLVFGFIEDTSSNIFLQEPVLKLNIDKTPNQASSITIKKLIETEPIFSSPPQLAVSSSFIGYGSQIISLDSFSSGNKSVALPDNDNSSCDSGVAFSTPLDNNNLSLTETTNGAIARRRKPATPHRIVCPSPIKSAGRVLADGISGLVPSGRNVIATKEQLNPRQSQRHAAIATSKTRRRLNHPEDQTPYTPPKDGSMANLPQDGLDNVHDNRQDENFKNLAARNVVVPHCCADTKKNFSNSVKSQSKTKSNVVKPQQPRMKNKVSQPLATTNYNRELTDFFPVRRSVRKTKTAVKEEMMRNLEQAVLEERAEGLKVAHFDGKGRGIVADRRFQRGEFVIEYVGDLISMSDATEREKRYALDENAGCYMYYFKHKNQQYCIDATVDTGKLGRLVNHSRNGNLITKVVVVKQRPHLILIAKDDVEAGEELTYDYGDRSKESLLHHPWLAF